MANIVVPAGTPFVRGIAVGELGVYAKAGVVPIPPTEVFATGFDGVTINAPVNFIPSDGTGSYHVANGGPIPNDRQYVCDFYLTGTDIDTGYPPPTMPPLSVTVRYGVWVIDHTYGFVTNDVPGVAGTATITYEDVVIQGQSARALTMWLTAPNLTIKPSGYGMQLWYALQRSATVDLPELSIQYDVLIPPLSTTLSSTHRRLTLFDVKTTGDYRYSVVFIRANSTEAVKFGVPEGTMGWEISGDSNANGPVTIETFYTVTLFKQCAPLSVDVTIPENQWISVRYYWKRAVNYADTTTGKFVFQMKRATDIDWVTVWEQNPDNNAAYNVLYPLSAAALNTPDLDNRNIHMGANTNKIDRLFVAGIYGDTLAVPITLKIANVKIWTGNATT